MHTYTVMEYYLFLINNFHRISQMTNLQRDIFIGIMFIVGIAGFISGEFIVSSVLFASAAIYSNIYLSRKLHG